jgi:hypothetical protein
MSISKCVWPEFILVVVRHITAILFDGRGEPSAVLDSKYKPFIE